MKTDADFRLIDENEKRICILLIHNTKVKRNIDSFKVKQEKKKLAKEKGLSLKEYEQQEINDQLIIIPNRDKFKPKVSNLKIFEFANFQKDEKKKEIEIEIKLKDENGKINVYDESK